MNDLITTHRLDFESSENHFSRLLGNHKLFRVGTCHGQWGMLDDSFYILSVINNSPGNGHLNDLFEWFEYACIMTNKNLLVLECFNNRFYNHLINKRGFVPLDAGKENVIKIFNKRLYKKLKKNGNGVLIAGTLKCV